MAIHTNDLRPDCMGSTCAHAGVKGTAEFWCILRGQERRKPMPVCRPCYDRIAAQRGTYFDARPIQAGEVS